MDNNYIVLAETTYDSDAYKALGKLYAKLIYKIQRLIALFLGAFFLASGITLILRKLVEGDYKIMVYIMIAFGVIALYLALCFDKFVVYFATKGGESGFIGVKNNYYFYDHEMVVKNEKAERTHTYSKLFRVYETKEYVFIFTSKLHFFIVRKSEIVEGSPMMIRDTMAPRVPRYILVTNM